MILKKNYAFGYILNTFQPFAFLTLSPLKRMFLNIYNNSVMTEYIFGEKAPEVNKHQQFW